MDSSIKSPIDNSELLDQNCLHGEFPDSRKTGVVLDAVETNASMIKEKGAPNGSFETLDNNDSNATYVEEMEKGPNVSEQSDLVVSMVEEVKHMDLKKSKPTRVIPTIKNEKPLSRRNVSSNLMKIKKDGNVEGSSALSRPKQQIKSKWIDDENTQLSKSSVKSDAASSKVDSSKLKHLKKEPDDTVGGTETTDLNAEDATPHRIGRLPNYGFSFKCDERAEKRREFYSKLEEKFHAKEVEKSNLQAKTKETQEAEIKMLRKSLTFKATPMPSFYQEPPPPKLELKKIPPTRAKSPKLGRRTSAEAHENASGNAHPTRYSLDEKISQDNSVKGISPVHVKKPQRRSLPRLPSERSAIPSPKGTGKGQLAKVTNDNINISNSTHEERSISLVQLTEENGDFTEPHEEKISTSITQDSSANEMLPAVSLDMPGETASYTNGEKDFEVPIQPALVQEHIGGDH